eukprot:TRINITY_DN49286_c0_g1_i1.p1 TRINITY_DN49286_c0_g1~~TRINITY_DN49286_c0_g1_i1.p1  ORF type:complete len:256 (-),score=15.53 TRINITY_DN49286_c0_g1_i1:285-1052(-)
MVAQRWSNALGDVVCAIELAYFFWDCCKRRAKPGLARSHKLYMLHLFAASAFCIFGAFVHLRDPLPVRTTPLWFAFILTMATAFATIPTTLFSVFHPSMSTRLAAVFRWWVPSILATHALCLLCAPELGAGVSAMANFDLLAGCVQPGAPCARGDCFCLHGALGGCSVIVAVALCIACIRHGFSTNADLNMEELRSLTVALVCLVVVLAVLPGLFDIVGLERVVDLWHILAFVILMFANLAMCPLICESGAQKAT